MTNTKFAFEVQVGDVLTPGVAVTVVRELEGTAGSLRVFGLANGTTVGFAANGVVHLEPCTCNL